MTPRPLTRADVQEIDRRAAEEYGVSTLMLMENAGAAVARRLLECRKLADSTSVLILCGPGNNGADGAVVARHLDAAGVRVSVAWVGANAGNRGDSRIQRAILDRSNVEQLAILDDLGDLFDRPIDWIVDGLFGTGLTRPIAGIHERVIDAANDSGRPILAIDIPSGLDADEGTILGTAISAEETVTFVAPKRGFAAETARGHLGRVTIASIGAPGRLLREFESRPH
ncbi:MAG: NAD(P)H-hydrate epimerase [Isosphaeraceae bacterium]|nr:NAD(P)H-hydrate epimerase [Isosphaeraceae bacterium]